MSLSDGVFLCYDRIGEWKPKEGEDIDEGYIEVPKIKEFIKELKEKLMMTPQIGCLGELLDDYNKELFNKIDKLAGDKLNGKN